jgi:short-subunit dehydrogenase
LGRAIAAALAAHGATVVVSSRKADELDELVASLPGTGHRAVVADLAEAGATLTLLEQAGEIDVLVANAALPASGELTAYSQHEIDRALRVNLESPIHMTRALLPRWQQRNSGHFAFVTSMAGFSVMPRGSLYAATKYGLRGFALNLREDLRGSTIGVSVVAPGVIGDAGMYADSGAPPPPAIGTATAAEVGGAVVRAIERDRSEVVVAPRRQRLLGRLAMVAPELTGRLANSTMVKTADVVASGQLEKR